MATDDYLWNRSGEPDPETKQLEELLAPLAHDEPLDEPRRRIDPMRATAHEPISKGKRMNIFTKRIIGPASLAAAAGLFGVTLYERHPDTPPPKSHSPTAAFAPISIPPALPVTPHAAPVAPATSADLAITAGESARIHAPTGEADIEIQSSCNAEVTLSVATRALELRHADGVAVPSEVVEAIDGTHSADGRTSTYHLAIGAMTDLGMYRYTSQCVGQAPIEGQLALDRDDAHGPIAPATNARVFSDSDMMITVSHGIHMFGTVMPGARVSVGATPLALEPVDPTGDDPPIDSAFSTDVPISLDHLGAVVRVDDAQGTHFYVNRASQVMVDSCKNIEQPKARAAKLDASGDHAGALSLLSVAIATCTPDRNLLALVTAYACNAGDAGAARSYWRKLPPELQRALEAVCARHGITREQLDK
jgi:hypothetical protein